MIQIAGVTCQGENGYCKLKIVDGLKRYNFRTEFTTEDYPTIVYKEHKSEGR